MADSPDQGQETAKQVASKFQVSDKGCGRRWQRNVAALHVSFLSFPLLGFWSVFMSSFAYFVSIFAFYSAFCLCSRRMSTTNV